MVVNTEQLMDWKRRDIFKDTTTNLTDENQEKSQSW